MFNGMFSGYGRESNTKKYISNQDDKSSMNTKVMRYANMVENSNRYIVTTYRAPSISGNVYPTQNPIFQGIAYVQGNLNVVPNYDMDRYNHGPSTGYLNVTRDITTISGDVHTNDIYISGNIFFTSTTFGFKSNIFSPSLVSLTQTTNAIYLDQTQNFTLITYGQRNTNQILQEDE